MNLGEYYQKQYNKLDDIQKNHIYQQFLYKKNNQNRSFINRFINYHFVWKVGVSAVISFVSLFVLYQNQQSDSPQQSIYTAHANIISRVLSSSGDISIQDASGHIYQGVDIADGSMIQLSSGASMQVQIASGMISNISGPASIYISQIASGHYDINIQDAYYFDIQNNITSKLKIDQQITIRKDKLILQTNHNQKVNLAIYKQDNKEIINNRGDKLIAKTNNGKDIILYSQKSIDTSLSGEQSTNTSNKPILVAKNNDIDTQQQKYKARKMYYYNNKNTNITYTGLVDQVDTGQIQINYTSKIVMNPEQVARLTIAMDMNKISNIIININRNVGSDPDYYKKYTPEVSNRIKALYTSFGQEYIGSDDIDNIIDEAKYIRYHIYTQYQVSDISLYSIDYLIQELDTISHISQNIKNQNNGSKVSDSNTGSNNTNNNTSGSIYTGGGVGLSGSSI